MVPVAFVPFALNVMVVWQAPPTQTPVPVHACPHDPQLLGSVSRLASQPSLATPLQLPVFGLHEATPHAPPRQKAVALGRLQTFAQPPQLSGSTSVSIQTPEQSFSGGAHDAVHVPIVQVSPAEHAVPADPASPTPQPAVAPQCWSFVEGSMQLPPQSICVGGQETEHAPLEHTWPAGHAWPQLPQFALSLPVFAQ
jgi:hypothetical protein